MSVTDYKYYRNQVGSISPSGWTHQGRLHRKVKSGAELRQCAPNRAPESFPGRGLCMTIVVTLNERTVQ